MPPISKTPTPWPSLPPFFKIFVSPPLFFVPALFKVFYTVLPTLTQLPPALIRPTNSPWLKQISKGWFTSSTVPFYQKSIVNLLNPFTIGYLTLWDILRFIFRQLRMIYFHKIMVAKKIFFLQMHNTILQRVK